jgi:hypothetical protein
METNEPPENDPSLDPIAELMTMWVGRMRTNRLWLKLYALPIIYLILFAGNFVYGVLAWYAPPVGHAHAPGTSTGVFGYYILDYLRTFTMINLAAIPAIVAYQEIIWLKANEEGRSLATVLIRLWAILKFGLLYSALPIALIITLKATGSTLFVMDNYNATVSDVIFGTVVVFATHIATGIAAIGLGCLGVIVLDVPAGVFAGTALPYAAYMLLQLVPVGAVNSIWYRFPLSIVYDFAVDSTHWFSLLANFGPSLDFYSEARIGFLIRAAVSVLIGWGILYRVALAHLDEDEDEIETDDD